MTKARQKEVKLDLDCSIFWQIDVTQVSFIAFLTLHQNHWMCAVILKQVPILVKSRERPLTSEQQVGKSIWNRHICGKELWLNV